MKILMIDTATENLYVRFFDDIEKMKSDLSKNNFYIEKFKNENINNENLIIGFSDDFSKS